MKSLRTEFIGSFNDVRKIPSDSRPQIAFGGRSNVGKSTLLNSLVGQKKLARTSKVPGRTQSLNYFLINDRYYFVDLPGYGYAKAPEKVRQNWGKTVDKYLNAVDNLRGFVFLLDCRRDPNEEDMMLLDWLENKSLEYIIVLTKADKLGRGALTEKIKEMKKAYRAVALIPFSSQTKMGRTEIWKWVDNIVDKYRTGQAVRGSE
ncbi:putative GTP-binding protein EngB [Candidatus Zixiibacteriota bacterium]|nr:putative GTP-binding protein EngB [candidate division Zixibacteria bacterium]